MAMNKENSKRIFTIPNIISVIRIILIPLFVYYYMIATSEHKEYYIYAGLILAVSGLTDMFDGMIARKFNQISNLGKILDPLADKLTQLSVVFCIAIKYKTLSIALALAFFVVKEILMLTGGFIMLRRKIVIRGSKWYGKIATFVFYVVMAAITFFDMSVELILVLIMTAAVFMIFAFANYFFEYKKIMKQEKETENRVAD